MAHQRPPGNGTPQHEIGAGLFAEDGMVYFVGSGGCGSDYLDFIGDISCPETLDGLLTTARDEVESTVLQARATAHSGAVPGAGEGAALVHSALRVGVHAHVDEMRPIIAEFTRLRPDWRIRLRLQSWVHPAAQVLDGTHPVAILRLPVADQDRLDMLLLRREFNRRLVFPSQPKLDNTAVASAMVAVE